MLCNNFWSSGLNRKCWTFSDTQFCTNIYIVLLFLYKLSQELLCGYSLFFFILSTFRHSHFHHLLVSTLFSYCSYILHSWCLFFLSFAVMIFLFFLIGPPVGLTNVRLLAFLARDFIDSFVFQVVLRFWDG